MNPEVDTNVISFFLNCALLLTVGLTIALISRLRPKDQPHRNKDITAPNAYNVDQPVGATYETLPRYNTKPERDRRNDNERCVSDSLRSLDRRHYVVIDDIQLKSNNPKIDTTQIDHLVISHYGIFVIETKGQRGYIFGSDRSAQWTQCRYDGAHIKFINPVRQNYGHILALINLLKWKAPAPMHSICIFTRADKLMLNEVPNVYYIDGALKYIRQFQRVVYTNEQIDAILATILDANQTSDYERERHVTQVTQLMAR